MRRLLTVLLGLVLLVSQARVSALSTDQLNALSSGIYYFDTEEVDCNPTGTVSSTAVGLPSTAAIENKIGQTFILGFDAGTDKNIIKDLFTKYSIGGMYLTGTSDAGGAGFNMDFYKSLSAAAGVQVLSASDEEGVVHRYAYPDGTLVPAAQMGDQAEAIGGKMAQTMTNNGLNTDLAPVLDLRDVGNGLTGRSFSSDPATVSKQAGAFAEGLQNGKVTPIFKHFPGFDSSTSGTTDDSSGGAAGIVHKQGDITRDVAPYKDLTQRFPNAGVMLSNMYVDSLDSAFPASISPKVVDYLKTTVGFNGLITTDDLAVKSVTQTTGGNLGQAVARSLQAGVSMPLFQMPSVNSTAQAEQVLGNIINTVKGSVDAPVIDQADAAVSKFKTSMAATTTANPDTNTSCCGSTSTLSGSGNMEKMFNYFVGKGLSAAQAAGILGNIQTESGFQPERLQGSPSGVVTPAESLSSGQENDGNVGWGIVQWSPSSKFIEQARKANKDPNDLAVQLDFLWGQLYGKSGDFGQSSPENRAGDDLKNQQTPEDASNSFGQNYERFQGTFNDDNYRTRAAQARGIFAQVSAHVPAATGSTDTTASSCGGGSLAGSSYQNPYRDVMKSKDFYRSRIDGGVDFGGTGPIYAVGPGVVSFRCDAAFTDYENDAACGWYGPRIVYKLTSGPANGKYIYFAEHCTLNDQLKVGSQVDSNTVLCTMKGSDSINTESGWSAANGWDYVEGSDYRANKDSNGNYNSNGGLNFNEFIQALGGPSGIPQGATSHNPLPNFPADWAKM